MKKINASNKTTIESYLRVAIASYVNIYINKGKCEICGSKENLEIHHDGKLFTNILEDAFDLTEMTFRKYTKEYAKTELDLLRYVVIGMDFECEYKVLCNKCHDKRHSKKPWKTVKYKSKKYLKKVAIAKRLNVLESDYDYEEIEMLALEKLFNEYKDVTMGKNEQTVFTKLFFDSVFDNIRHGERSLKLINSIMKEKGFASFFVIAKQRRIVGEQRERIWALKSK
jgi:hypothetical protein